MPKNFALTGVAGYIAPRHLKAIKETGNNLLAAVDPHDSVGILDSYFNDVRYFPEFERFDRHVEKLRRKGNENKIHYVSICSPNYLHDAHIRFALRVGADAICEKPLVINPWNLDPLKELETENGKKVYVILQLRVHPVIIKLKEKIEKESKGTKHEVCLTYITTRGNWYLASWKGQTEQSGGLVTNIGIHFFDLLIWLFGSAQFNEVHLMEPKKAAGFLELEKANIKWFLSIDQADLPQDSKTKNQRTFRSITIDEKELEFSQGFTDLHTVMYQEILAGKGFGIEDSRTSIDVVYNIRNAIPTGIKENSHHILIKK